MIARRIRLLLLLATLAGCVKGNDASIEMLAICAVPDACNWGNTCDMVMGGNYTYDVSLPVSASGLWIPMEVHNQLVTNDNDTGGVNTNDATVRKVIVDWSVPGGTVGSVTTDTAQAVPAGGTQVVFLDLLDSAAWSDLSAVAVPAGGLVAIATVKLKGDYKNGSRWETGPYRIPVDLCDGCAAAYLVCEDPTQTPTSPCMPWSQWPNEFSCVGP